MCPYIHPGDRTVASIEKRNDPTGAIRYRVKIRIQGYPHQSATFDRLTDARKWAQSTETALREERYSKTSEATRHTLGDLVDRYLRDVLPTKPKSAGNQIAQLTWWKQQIGTYALADVTPFLLAEFRDRLIREPLPNHLKDAKEVGRHRGPATVNRYLAALSHAFTIAIKEWGWVEENPFRKVSKPKEPHSRVRFLSDEERTRLLAACQKSGNPDLYPAVVLALSTGARQMEIMTLRWSQVDLGRGLIVLEETKNGDRRALPLAGKALALMRERGNVRRTDTDLLFPGSDPKKPIHLRFPWEAALKAAHIENFHWHDLRHSAASYLAMNEASLAEIAEVLGHRRLQMVKRYSHLSVDHTAGVVARMNEKIFG